MLEIRLCRSSSNVWLLCFAGADIGPVGGVPQQLAFVNSTWAQLLETAVRLRRGQEPSRAYEAAIEGDPTTQGVTDDCETKNPVSSGFKQQARLSYNNDVRC